MAAHDSARLAIVGAGSVGAALASGLARTRPIVIWSRRAARARALARRVEGAVSVRALSDATDAAGVIVCVKDEALAEVAGRLAAESRTRPLPRRFALHTSGFHGEDVLAPLARAGWATGAMHPLTSVPRGAPASTLEGAWFAISGAPAARKAARAIVADLAGHPLALRAGTQNRARYHAAASLLAGGLTALFDAVLEVQDGAVTSRRASRSAYARLAESVLENLARQAPAACLTGPAARGDADVVRGHLAVLGRSGRRGSTRDLYASLTARMLTLASESKSLSPADRRRIARLFTD